MVNNKNWAHYFAYVATSSLYEIFDNVRFLECIKRIQVCSGRSMYTRPMMVSEHKGF
jgi:hypothetical protein